ncbi:MAG: hypothetical protein ACO2PN_19165 [Pyrobaculum sp.]|jgi:hypothetical protein
MLEDIDGDHRIEGLRPVIFDEPFRRQNIDVFASLYIDSDMFPRPTGPLN